MAKYVVAPADAIPPGGRKRVTAGGRAIVVFNLGGEFFALLDRCPHRGASLSEGIVTGLVQSDAVGSFRLCREGEILRCPWHGWEFDIRTGHSQCRPNRVRAQPIAVQAEEGADVAEEPYVHETFPVAVERQYLVVEA